MHGISLHMTDKHDEVTRYHNALTAIRPSVPSKQGNNQAYQAVRFFPYLYRACAALQRDGSEARGKLEERE